MFTHHFTKFLPSTINIDFVNGQAFADTDSLELYQKNLLNQPLNWHYREKNVSIFLNSEKYRCPEFNTIDWQKSVVIFGCSHAFGMGLDESETISFQLSKKINRPVINLGVSGASNMHILFNTLVLKNLCDRPYAIIILWSSYDRVTYFKNLIPEISNIGSWTTKYQLVESNFFNAWNLDKNNAIANSLLVQQMQKFLWKDTLFIEGSFFPSVARNLNCKLFKPLDYARDHLHYGPITHKSVAEYFAEKIT